MRRDMLKTFPQLDDVKIDHAWGGFVDVTRNRAPDFGSIDPNYFYVQGFSGHGVALTGIAGRVVTKAMAGETAAFDLFARLRHARVPGGPALRGPAAANAITAWLAPFTLLPSPHPFPLGLTSAFLVFTR
ncbi:hypothetical protein LMG28614_03493 [Paraburkholderia ultramafica]|uniref:FAD dependent oxidoreductase domain-containing protein n=1 Tax=Paraburkholderia ultramafica TaxID=1544867 RepID=A0A6S7B931_9BURK|nr:hypothetical protein LMG28614_03493 [Paraburkholderia ultramafica]